jgi:hypothetical protein
MQSDTTSTYTSTHQRRSLFEGNTVREMNSSVWIGQHVFGERAIVSEASYDSVPAEARIRTLRSSCMLSTTCAMPTGVLIIQNTNAISNLPQAFHIRTNLSDLAGRLVRWDHRVVRRELSIPYLQIRVTESGCVDFDEKIIVSTLRYSSLT